MLQEFYKCTDKIMHLETAGEIVHASKSTSSETQRETAWAGKSTPAEKSEASKKCKNGDRRRSPAANNKKAKSSYQRVPRPPPSK